MPNRIIKESLCTSEKISSLTDFEFRLWVGLITQVDDAGRGDARPAIIKGRVFPLRERVSLKEIENALHGLAAKGCVSLYKVDGKPYFWFPTWSNHQRIRDAKPKYPDPSENDASPQVAASRGESRPESNPIQYESKSESESEGDAQARENLLDGRSDALCAAFADWLAYKTERKEGYKATGLKSLITEVKNNADRHGDDAVAAIIRRSMASGWKGICFDKLSENAGKPAVPTKKGGNYEPGDYEREAVARRLAKGE